MPETAKPSVRAMEWARKVTKHSVGCLPSGGYCSPLCIDTVERNAQLLDQFAHEERSRLREALDMLVNEWMARAGTANRLADEHIGDSAGNTFAFLKERRVWTTCANELKGEIEHAFPAISPTPGAPEGSETR
jgi:hypothetical protein